MHAYVRVQEPGGAWRRVPGRGGLIGGKQRQRWLAPAAGRRAVDPQQEEAAEAARQGAARPGAFNTSLDFKTRECV